MSLTIDGVDRVSRYDSVQIYQDWTLDHLGNWDEYLLSVDQDTDGCNGTNDVDEDRIYDKESQLTDRDDTCEVPAEYEYGLTWDAVGNLTDDDESFEYQYDIFYRLVEVRDQSDNLVADLEYNGLGQLMTVLVDTDGDSDVDQDDDVRHNVYDDGGRLVATYLDSETFPHEEFAFHDSGAGDQLGRTNVVGLRERDLDDDDDFSGGTDDHVYYCFNPPSVVALVSDAGEMIEWVKYSATGVPFAIPAGDLTGDAATDGDDVTEIDDLIANSLYDSRGDVDLDGELTGDDKTWIEDTNNQKSLGWGVLSDVGSRIGHGGSEYVSEADAYVASGCAMSASLGETLGCDWFGPGGIRGLGDPELPGHTGASAGGLVTEEDEEDDGCSCQDESNVGTVSGTVQLTGTLDGFTGTIQYEVTTKSCSEGGGVDVAEQGWTPNGSPDDQSFDGTDILEALGIGLLNISLASVLQVTWDPMLQTESESTKEGCDPPCTRIRVTATFDAEGHASWLVLFGYSAYTETVHFVLRRGVDHRGQHGCERDRSRRSSDCHESARPGALRQHERG